MSDRFLSIAIDAAWDAMESGGGPFGAVVARGDEVIAVGRNEAEPSHDPTAHAEVMAIRHACRKIGTRDLAGCVLYASCYPCPMCLAAAYWANLREIRFAVTEDEAARHGFDDEFIRLDLALPSPKRRVLLRHVPVGGAERVMEEFSRRQGGYGGEPIGRP